VNPDAASILRISRNDMIETCSGNIIEWLYQFPFKYQEVEEAAFGHEIYI